MFLRAPLRACARPFARRLAGPMIRIQLGLAILLLLSIAGCTRVFEDNGVHLAFAIEKGAQELRASSSNELVVRYETLDATEQSYYVEITPSLGPSATNTDVWGSYLVVSGKTSGGTSHHNGFVFVPNRLYIEKPKGGPSEVVLRKDGDRIDVAEVR
jgi:hypothetical protein